MNRLRVRLSFAFGGVVLLVLLIPVLIGLTARLFGFTPFEAPSETFASLSQAEMQQLMDQVSILIWRQFILYLAGTAVIGSIAGLIVSRSLTAPLHRLADAATDIGQGNLNRRVEESGTDEIRDVAHAFNEMAHDLEHAEALRQSLLNDVAHELRTPLTVVQGNLRAILDDVYALDKEEIARIYDQTRLLTRLIDDLRTLAQAEAHRLPLNQVDIDLADLVKSTATSFKPLAQENQIDLRIELLGRMPRYHADADRLAQCVQNLINNALQHTPTGGQITVQAEQVGNQAVIRIKDSGHGMTPEQIEHVFDRFYRADGARDRETGGTGLGLAITYALVEAHGGRVSAESDGIGRGSQFIMHLPNP